MIALNRELHSASVSMYLILGDKRIELGHLGPNFALLGKAESIEQRDGDIELTIDDRTDRWPIKITKPPTAENRRFEFESVGQQ